MKNDNLLLKIRGILLKHGYALSDEDKYEEWRKNACLVYIYVQSSDRFGTTFFNVTITKQGYSKIVVVTNGVKQFERVLMTVESRRMHLSKEVLEGKTHFNF